MNKPKHNFSSKVFIGSQVSKSKLLKFLSK